MQILSQKGSQEAMNTSFVLFTKIDEVVRELTLEEKGKLFQAILDYQKTGEVPEMDKLLKVVFLPIKHDMDYCEEQKQKAQQQKSEAGKKSAEARSTKANAVEQKPTPLNAVEHRSTKANAVEHNINVDIDVNVDDKNNNTPLPPSTEGDGGVWTDPLRNPSKKEPAKKKQSEVMEERFERFWSVYPKKVGKGDARKSFLKIAPSDALLGEMLAAIAAASASFQWKKDKGRFIPNPATWLNQQRWEDELRPDMGMPDPKQTPPNRTRFSNFEERPYDAEDDAIGTAWLSKGG